MLNTTMVPKIKLYKSRFLPLLLIAAMVLTLGSCGFEQFTEDANEKFGDQHFKTAISLIELHNIRNGEYPESLADLEHTGDWDLIIFQSVEYTKLETGYELNLVGGVMGNSPDLAYPDDFWNGLGLVSSNLKK